MDSKALYRKYFKRMPDDSIHFLGEKLIIQIPEGFVERGITKIIQTTVNTIGIFEGYISDICFSHAQIAVRIAISSFVEKYR